MTEMADLAIKVPSDQTNYIQKNAYRCWSINMWNSRRIFFKKLIHLFSKSSAFLSNDFS
ncbi:MAG: hypothetical protein CM15mP93_16960 [Thiotrichaceae bacterium]|nr:MAG: hypothetical protein CM15mP93_16960 [Thiotrichaceae bacterium]